MKTEISIRKIHPGNRLRLMAGLPLLPEEPLKLPLPTYTAPGSCPKCGRDGLRILTWLSIGSDQTSLGCWSCDYVTFPPGVEASWLASKTA